MGWRGIPAPAPNHQWARQLVIFLEPYFSHLWNGDSDASIMHCDGGMTQHALLLKGILLFQAISPRGTFKNSNNLLIVVLKIPQYIILMVSNTVLWLKIYWSQGWKSGSVLKISFSTHTQGEHFQSCPVTCIFHDSPSLTPAWPQVSHRTSQDSV